MKIILQCLKLRCRMSRELVDFSNGVTYIHGQISAGKSSILRLIDFCLGGDLERTPAISQELVGVQLHAQIAEYEVIFERELGSSNLVEVTWKDAEGQLSSVLAPLNAPSNGKPIWQDDIQNFSDLVFHLAGITPIKVRKSKQDDSSGLVRLSIRDLLWYCYLDQDNLDSSFYRLEDPFRRLKSRDVMRFVTGYYTERMNELEIELEKVINDRNVKMEAAKQVRSFLISFGLDGEVEVRSTIQNLGKDIQDLDSRRETLRTEYFARTHFADDLRQELRNLSQRLGQEELSLADLDERIREQEALKAELLSAKFKLAKTESAASVLSGVAFERCPSCGTDLGTLVRNRVADCYLCGSTLDSTTPDSELQVDVVRSDIRSRIADLDESISQHIRAQVMQTKKLALLAERKNELDRNLTEALAQYDSDYLSRSQDMERRIGTLHERVRNLNQTAKMFDAITDLEIAAEKLRDRELAIKHEITLELNKLGMAEERVSEIEDSYREALLAVGVPGMSPDDRVEINRRTWVPWIIPVEGDKYNFYNAGSGGKKTLLNVCYALAIHKVAAKYDLPLPTFLMIDTPMKNIGEDVNRNIFQAFYTYLYTLASSTLANTQLVIVDKEFFPPPNDVHVHLVERFMSPDQPLISYYRGA